MYLKASNIHCFILKGLTVSCLIGLLRLMEEDHFTALLESYEDKRSLKVCSLFDLSNVCLAYNIWYHIVLHLI